MKRLTFTLLTVVMGCGLLEDPGLEAWSPVAFTPSIAPPAGYYERALNLAGPGLVTTLHAIIDKHVELGYDSAREQMFSVVDDLDNDDTVGCILTGKAASGVTSRLSAYRKGLNTEHTWPQSLGAEGMAKSDLHHLFPSETYVNEMRGNFPYAEVARTVELLPDHLQLGDHAKFGTSPTGDKVFEPPNRSKGNIARALLYFYVRYAANTPFDGGLSMRNFKQEKRQLLTWHRMDPVDDAERARNQAIFELQHNRNPFIDHPEFVDRLAEWLGS